MLQRELDFRLDKVLLLQHDELTVHLLHLLSGAQTVVLDLDRSTSVYREEVDLKTVVMSLLNALLCCGSGEVCYLSVNEFLCKLDLIDCFRTIWSLEFTYGMSS